MATSQLAASSQLPLPAFVSTEQLQVNYVNEGEKKYLSPFVHEMIEFSHMFRLTGWCADAVENTHGNRIREPRNMIKKVLGRFANVVQ